MDHYIMDYETMINCFTAVFKHYKTKKHKDFVVHKLRNDFEDFYNFLKQNIKDKSWHISFNGLDFDAQISHYVLDNGHKWIKDGLDAEQIALLIYTYAQKVIDKSSKKEFLDYPLFKMKINQIDLYKLNHWDNAAKRSSLKWIQFSMDWENLKDMPIKHYTSIHTAEDINTILNYCYNDVDSTDEIFERSKSQISLRKELTKNYNMNLFSASEPKISKEIFAYYLSLKMDCSVKFIKELRTVRNQIVVKDLILPYIKFSTPEFQKLYQTFSSKILDPYNLKGSFKYEVNYKNVITDFGLGGVHGAAKSGVYASDEEYVIISSDVVSFYPNLAIKNQWSPGHFNKQDFCSQYEWFFNERRKIPKKNPMNYVYKIILNSTYGLSNDENSFFYDPELTMRITVNGQLSLMMLYEMIMTRIPNAQALLQNTDGLETRIPRKYLDEYYAICKEWEELTNLQLEHADYNKIIIGDVNNYIALEEYSEVNLEKFREIKKENPHFKFKIEGDKFYVAAAKTKGRFDFHNLALHKNKSKLIVPKAVYNYFIHDTLPRDYIKTNRNILDYCIVGRTKKGWKQVAKYIRNGVYKEKEIQSINRYYISSDPSKSCKIVKVNTSDKREIQFEAGAWLQRLFNKIEVKPKFEDYKVNETYYIKAIESEIDKILNSSINQLNLFS